MNKIFKVIWSKSKQCYIVVSEIAKNKTGKKKIVVASILAALTMTANIVTVEGAIPEGSRTDQLGLAIGTGSNSKSNQSVAIGYASSAEAPGANPENPATAVGAGANADGTGTVALGLSANATGANAVALGGGSNSGTNKTEATATNATAVGFNAKASNSGASAIGSGAKASGSDSISFGTGTVADSEKAIAIGAGSKATNIGATALGRSSAATAASATALGSLASATGTTATAVGMQASASGAESLAIGNTASATSGRSLAVGTNAKATGASAVAVGSGAGNSGPLGFASSINSSRSVVNTLKTVNYATTAEGDNAVALGFYANAKNTGVAVGQNALAATGGVAIGKGVFEDTNNNLAGGVVIGQDSASTGIYSLAMGRNAFATGSTSMAMGYEASANGNFAVAMGRNVSATGTSTAIGHHATATNGGLAIGGQDNDASNDKTTASAKGAVAIGKNTTASSEDAVAIGTNAQSNKLGAVALGSGSTTATSATNIPSATINGITYNFAGATSNPNMQVSVGSASATRQIKNVAAGEVSATSTDAINGSQLYAVASAIKPIKYVSINSTATGTDSNFDNDGAKGGNSIAIGPSSSVTRTNGIAIGSGAQSLSEDSVVIGRNAKAETKAGAGLTTTSRAIVIGSNSRVAADITQGIAIGSGNSPDEGAVVTGDQSIAIGGNVKVDGHSAIAIGGDDARKAANQQVSYTSTNDVEVTGTLQTAIQNLTGYNLSKYKGTEAGHAGVAYGTSALAGNAGVAIGTASDSMTRMNDKGQVVNNKPVTNAVAIGTGARANFDNSVAIGGGSNTDHYATKQVNAIVDGVEVKWSGGENISPGDIVSFGAKGFERQLKNVAPGEVSQTSTDAINGSQIYSLARKITNIMNGGAGSLVNVNATGEPLTKVVTGTGANKQEKYYLTADVKDDGTLEPGAVAQTPKSLALVNVGEPNVNQQTKTPRTLSNVADGVKDNDAVNVSQLKASTVKYFSVNSTDAGNRDNTGATGTNAIAIGPTAKSTGDNGLAIGNNAQANSNFAVALGHYANNGSINSANSISIGWTAGGSSNGASNVAIGTNAGKQITGNNNISLGNTAGTVTNNNVYTSESILLGTEARVKGSTSSKSVNNVIAIGKSAEGSAASATSIGINASASAENAMALGPSSKASAYNGVALGSYSEATTAAGTAGYNANSSRTDKYAGLTGLALTANTGAVSIGSSTKTRQITNLAAGTNDTDAVNVAQLKSVNLAVKGNSGAGGDVNLATNPLTIKGNDDYITTSASGNTVNISGKVQNINVSNGTAAATTGMADAKNVADAINKAVSQNAYNWNLTADNDTAGSRSTINKEGTVKFSGDQNITVKRDGNTITSSLNKSIIVDSVKANNSVTTGSGSNQITLDGTIGTVTGKTFSGQSFTAGDNVLSNTTLQIGSPTNGDNNVTITKDGLTSKAGTKTAKFGANGIDAGGQQITNVSSGGNVGTNAANITDVKNAVSDVTLKLDTNSKTGTVKLSESPLKVIGSNGIRTDLVGTNNGSLVIGLDQATVNATTKGIGLTGDTGSTGNKYLKDGDVSFAVTGDGNLVSTSATTAGVKVAVNAAKVKDLAVEAVTVSKDTQADNPITVTPTAGTNSKDYAIGIDTTKLAGKTDLTYRANNDTDANAQKVSLAKGLNFVNGDNTVATVAADGKVSYDLNAATKTKINDSATAVARNISLGADSGTASSQSLKDGNVAFNVKGATGDYVSTNMNGNTVEISTTRATINSDANTGAASVTGNDGLATAKNVADAINKAADAAKAGAAWNVSTNGNAGTKVSGGDTVDFTGDNNITVTQTGRKISTTLNKDLKKISSISLEDSKMGVETITIDGGTSSAKFKLAGSDEYSLINHDGVVVSNGAPNGDPNEQRTIVGLDRVQVMTASNNTALTSKNLLFNDEDGNLAEGSAKGFIFQSAAGKQVQFGVDEIKAGGNKIQEVAEGTDDTDAVNVKQLKDTVASQTLTYRANTAADADAKSVKLSKGLDFVDGTSTTATIDNDGKVSFDLNTATKTKIDDSATAVARNISLGADSGTASSQSLKDGNVAFNVKGATGDYVSTNMNGNTVEISTTRATINSDANTGAASVTGNDGLATAKNVADAINKAADAAKAGAAWNLTTNSSTTDKTSVQGGDTVDLINGDNILITQDGTDKKKITVATKKDLTVDSVTAGNTVINTTGLTNGTTAITGAGITTDKVTVGGISIDKTDGINAGGKAITNVASGGTTDTNAANIGDVKQAVANLSQNLNITDGTNNGTVDLKNQKLNVAGANGVTATVNNQTITVGLDADTVNATTKGIGLTADTGSTGNKYLKDGDVSFAVTGDGNLVSTSATAAGVKVAVDATKVKDLAVDAVTVSKDAQADNPITVTPTAGTNSKDYAIGIDTTKLATKTDLTYRANNDTDANAKKVSLAKGLNFVNGTLTTASIDNDGVVKYDVNTAAITAGTDGTVTGPTTDGVATAQNVADAINAAKKASKTEITANTGEAANATTGNVTLTSTTAADGHTIYDVKLNDTVNLGTGANAVTIDGTAGKATIGTAVVDGVNNTITTGGTSPVTLDGATGTITGKTANIGGVTVNGTTNDITGLSNTTVTGADFATKGRAATEEQLKAVTGATALKFTGDVATNTGSINLKDDTFGIKGDGKYISTDVNGKDVNLTVSEAEVKKSAVAAVTVSTDTTDANNPISVTPTTSADGTTKDYKVTIDGTKIANKTNLSYKANDGTAKQVSLADGLNFKNGTLTTASIDDAGVVKYDVNTATITAGTDGTVTGPTTDGVATAQNVADAINAAKKASKTEITANTGEAANATTGNVTLTSTTAADGHTIYDVKLNDKVTLGTGANAVTIDGATGKVTAKNAVIGGVTVDGDNSHVTGLSNTTWNGTATTGRAATEDQLKAVADTAKATTDAVNLKFSGDTNTSAGVVNLKDDTFNIVGDGKYVTTDANGKDLTVKVSEAEVKKSAVAAVTVSTDTTDANNPISVTPTTSADGTTKDYKVTIDGTKIANKTNLSYKANDGTAKQVSLADGLNFKNGTLTTASIDDAGVVKYDVNTATITAGTDGTVTGPTTDGVATAQNVADAINAAKKAAKTEITANTGEAANATTGNVTLTSTTATDGHTIYDVKLNDTVTLGTGSNAVTIDGTAGKATIGSSVVDGVNNTITTGGANAVALDGVAGTVKTGTVTVTGGTTNDITGLSNTTVTSADFATKGRAATEEQLKAVGEQTWQITADKDATTSGNQTGTKKDAKVGKDDKVQLIAGENLTVNQNERDFTYSLNKDLVKMNSATFEATGGKTTVITGDSIAQTDGTKTNTSTAAGNTVADGGKSTATTADGMTVTNGADSTATTAAGTTVTNANGNTKYAADGVRINTTGKNPVSLTDAGLDNGNNVIKNVASGHVNNDDTDNTNAANIADVKKATTTVTANNGEAANATTGNVTLTSTTAADGHTIYDVKLNDKVTLGTGNNAVTIDGTAGKATIGSSVVDGVNNTITTGGANAVTMDGAAGTIKTGTVTVTGGTTNDITGLSNTTVTSADFATKGRAATEEQLKAVGEQTWQITADKDATTSGNQTGTKKDAKVGKDDKVQLIAGENLTVNQNERDFTYSLNKDLVKMNSATFEATGGKTTVITGDSIAQTDGTKTNKSTAAGNTVADGGKSTATTADGTTVTNGADSTATTAAGTTVTNANGNTNYAADGVRINTTGKDPVSLTDAGLDNGNNVIKNVASGHVNNDDTDNTNAANIADVKKATTTVTANNGEAANATTGNVTLTSTTAADGHTIYNVKLNDTVILGTGANAVTIDGTAGKATIGSSVVDGVNNTITTGGANAVALDGVAGTVKTGTVTVTGGATNDITGLANTTVNSADFATKGRAATEEQLKAVGEQTWQITADKDATTSGNQTGTKKDAKVGKDDKVQLIAGENLTVNQNERDFTYSLNKDLVKMNSATFEATGGKTTVITGDSITQTDGTKTNTSTAAGNTVADGTKSTETTAAGQVIKDGAKSNKSTVDSNVIDDGNGNVNTSNATSNTIANGTDSTATTAAGTTVTNANGNTKYAADGVRINTTGKNPVSLTDAGLDNGNNVIKNVASGHVNNDDTDNTNAANIADVKKATTTVTANNGEAANATTGNVTLTSTTAADGHTIYDVKLNDKVTLGTGNNAVTIDGTAGKATIGSSVVDGVNNTITTGGSNAVTMDGAAGTVKTGTVTVTGGTTNDITGLSNTTVNSADFATKGRAATEEQLKQVGEQTWQITADKDATTSGNQTGTKKDAKVGKDDKVQLIAGENLTVNQNERDFTFSLNKDLVKMNSATFEATGGKTTVITGDSITQTDGTKTNTSTAAGNTITDGTNTTEATASTVTVKDNAGNSTVITKDTITTGTGANKVTVDGTTGKVTAGSAVVDGVNNTITTGGANTVKLDGAAGTVTGLTNTAWTPGVTKAVSGRAATEDQLQQVSDAVGAGWNINSGTVAGSTGEANGSAKTKISSGEEVQLQAGNNLIIDQNGKTLAYSLNKNLKDMESAIFNATGGKTTVIKGDSIVQTDGGKTNTSNAAGNTVVDGTKSTATTAAGTTITDGAKTNTNTADKNVIDDGAGNTNTSNATSNTIADPNGNTNTATATNNTLADNAGNSNVSNATSNSLTDNAGNSNVSNATSNTLKNAAGDETKVDAKGATVKDAAGNTTNVAATGATVTNAAGDTTKVEATGTTVADAAGNKATFTKDGVTITKPGKDTVSLTGNGLDNGNNKIVNVADGTNDTDAVNVRQLDAKTKAATTELTANGGESADNTTGNIVLTKTTAPDGHIIYDNKLNDKITLGAANPTKAITVDGTNGTIKAGKDGNAVAINGTDGTIKAGDGTNAVAIDGVNGSVKVADKIALDGKDGKAAIGTVGIDGKDGIITTGGNNPVAVNGKDGVVTGLTNKTWNPNNITSGRAATEDQVQSAVANAGWDATVGTEGSGVNSTPSATPEKIRPNETLTFKAGNNMMVSHAGKTISYAVNPELTDMKSATFKDTAGNTTVTNGNGITITPGSANPNNPNAGPVSLTKDGLNNGNNQIKGVAPGSDDTDAVNIGQLKASNAKMGDAIGQVAGEVQRVGAHAAAMAALKPIQYDPLEPTQIMAGVGNYRGETAAALGLAHYTNEDTMFNVGVSVGGNHNMVNAGVTHKFGSSPEKKNIPDRYKAGPISSVYVMQDEVSSLKKENAEQKYVIADQAARLNTLEAENERQRQELAETKQGLDDLRAAVDKLLAAKG